MKSNLLKVFLTFALVAFLPLSVYAITIDNPIKANTLADFLQLIITAIRNISIPIAVLMIVVGGFFFVTAQGSPDKIKKGRDIIMWALIGVLVILCAEGLVRFVTSNLVK